MGGINSLRYQRSPELQGFSKSMVDAAEAFVLFESGFIGGVKRLGQGVEADQIAADEMHRDVTAGVVVTQCLQQDRQQTGWVCRPEWTSVSSDPPKFEATTSSTDYSDMYRRGREITVRQRAHNYLDLSAE